MILMNTMVINSVILTIEGYQCYSEDDDDNVVDNNADVDEDDDVDEESTPTWQCICKPSHWRQSRQRRSQT